MSRQASGLKAWVIQRVTAIYLALFVLYAVAVFLFAPPPDYQAWRALVTAPAMAVALLLFFVFLLLHAWIGMRDVAIDYLRGLPVRVVFLSIFAVALVAAGIRVAMVLVTAMAAG
jgi:succinate dehydrogenase / fumarate reductase membrane anchor subunit